MLDPDPWLNDTIMSATIIPHEFLALEAFLSTRKWPAYRFLTPLEATRLFKAAYVAEYRRYYARNIDYRRAPDLWIGGSLDLARNSPHNTQLWRARQIADSLGMPYEEYLGFTFGFAEARTRKHAPQPNQLGPSAQSEVAWRIAVQDYWTPERRLFALEREDPLPEYHIANDAGLPAQSRFREDLLELGDQGTLDKEGFLFTHVVMLERLDPAACAARFPDWIALEPLKDALVAKAEGAITPYGYPALAPAAILPSCFGLPGIRTDTEPVCAACPCSAGCQTLRQSVTGILVSRFGTGDPVAAMKRALNAERQRRHRARKRGGSAAPAKGEPDWMAPVRKALEKQAHIRRAGRSSTPEPA